MFQKFYEDLDIGAEYNFGGATITKEEIIAFATEFDPQPFHLNEEFAKHSVFGGLCASGWHTASKAMRMRVDYIMEQGLASMGSPGVEQLNWDKPVFPGDTLSIKWKLLEKRVSKSRPGLGFVKFSDETYNQNGEKVMTMTATLMVLLKQQPSK